LAESGYQIGVTARITAIQLGFGVDIITWMGFFIAPQRLYEFFDEQELQFLYDPADTYEMALKRRKKKAKEALLQIGRANIGEETPEGEPEEVKGDEEKPDEPKDDGKETPHVQK